MNQHTQRLLMRMLQMLDDYESNQITLRRLVDDMEWTINAFSENMTNFIDEWRPYWGELEIILSIRKEKKRHIDIAESIKNIRRIIKAYLNS